MDHPRQHTEVHLSPRCLPPSEELRLCDTRPDAAVRKQSSSHGMFVGREWEGCIGLNESPSERGEAEGEGRGCGEKMGGCKEVKGI